MSQGVRRGLAGVLLSVVAFAVGWVLLYGVEADAAGVVLLLAGMVGVLVSLVLTAVGLLRSPRSSQRS